MSDTFDVLLVEDNPADADLAMEIIEEGYPVRLTVASDGIAALERLQDAADHRLPDLVLLDLNLPRMDGRRLLVEMKASPALRAIPVVILTSSTLETDVIESYRLGANSYVNKAADLTAFRQILSGIQSFWFDVARLPSRGVA